MVSSCASPFDQLLFLRVEEVQAAQDAPHVHRNPVACRAGDAVKRMQGISHAAGAVLIEHNGVQLFLGVGQACFASLADEAGKTLVKRGQSAQERRQFRYFRDARLFRETHENAAQQSHQAFRTLHIAAEPKQVVGGTAGQVVAAAIETDGARRGTQHAERADRPGGQHPGILAAAPLLERDYHRVARCGEPGQPARHEREGGIRGGQVSTHDKVASADPLVGEHRRGGQVEMVLAHVSERIGPDLVSEIAELVARQFLAEDRIETHGREGRLDNHPLQIGQHVLAGLGIAAPVGRHRGQVQFLA